ncbi:SDR family NAD(P)-dependent oxidoreductase [Pedobacter sp. UBA5917]|jgi:NAD(P)-dependent dehydrogenase (short-subunit alcohol dehydrogenase family)|uniref:SDR family NAD(P)-dependent oxidoreductase n=1 Tax=Pedobacter sp. UBA5917 TaxID=1947061 RepID=UPI0025E6A39B|nr:SDR family oxidoreductase [Pedobacter sp. UBA5917]
METNKKIALVTGGSRGLGKNMALRIAEKGINVIITYHSNETEAKAVVQDMEKMGVKALALQFDGGNLPALDGFVARLKNGLQETFGADKFDFLINNAGIGINAPFAQTTQEQFDTLSNLLLKGPYFLTQLSLPILNDGGSIINISSGLARFVGPGYAAYGAMKTAMETLSRYQAVELGARQIRCNTVAPGAIETDFGGGMVRDNQVYNDAVKANTALGRVGLPQDIGGVVAFLCTPDAGWISGQRIEVSGGMRL